jgi:hypothetical protein
MALVDKLLALLRLGHDLDSTVRAETSKAAISLPDVRSGALENSILHSW